MKYDSDENEDIEYVANFWAENYTDSEQQSHVDDKICFFNFEWSRKIVYLVLQHTHTLYNSTETYVCMYYFQS